MRGVRARGGDVKSQHGEVRRIGMAMRAAGVCRESSRGGVNGRGSVDLCFTERGNPTNRTGPAQHGRQSPVCV
eukprot:3346374-Prymnesium_polylepis.1